MRDTSLLTRSSTTDIGSGGSEQAAAAAAACIRRHRSHSRSLLVRCCRARRLLHLQRLPRAPLRLLLLLVAVHLDGRHLHEIGGQAAGQPDFLGACRARVEGGRWRAAPQGPAANTACRKLPTTEPPSAATPLVGGAKQPHQAASSFVSSAAPPRPTAAAAPAPSDDRRTRKRCPRPLPRVQPVAGSRASGGVGPVSTLESGKQSPEAHRRRQQRLQQQRLRTCSRRLASWPNTMCCGPRHTAAHARPSGLRRSRPTSRSSGGRPSAAAVLLSSPLAPGCKRMPSPPPLPLLLLLFPALPPLAASRVSAVFAAPQSKLLVSWLSGLPARSSASAAASASCCSDAGTTSRMAVKSCGRCCSSGTPGTAPACTTATPYAGSCCEVKGRGGLGVRGRAVGHAWAAAAQAVAVGSSSAGGSRPSGPLYYCSCWPGGPSRRCPPGAPARSPGCSAAGLQGSLPAWGAAPPPTPASWAWECPCPPARR